MGLLLFCKQTLSCCRYWDFNTAYDFRMVSVRAFIFHMFIRRGKNFPFIPRSRSNIKVTFFKTKQNEPSKFAGSVAQDQTAQKLQSNLLFTQLISLKHFE